MTTYIYALGFFDGVHLGHQALLRAVKTLATEGCRGVVTFSGHPDTLVLGTTPALINTAEDRENLLRNYGMDRVVTLPFDKKMQSTPWEDFLEELRRDFGAGGFVCGEDFRFGAMGTGTASLLQDYCEKEGLPCAVVPEQEVSGVRISSTYIRELLTQGRMAEADTFLGHPHVLSGTVVSDCHTSFPSMLTAVIWAGPWAFPLPICTFRRGSLSPNLASMPAGRWPRERFTQPSPTWAPAPP